MSILGEAIEAANARKSARLNDPEVGELYFTDDSAGRAIISGFDIDYDEMVHVIQQAGEFFTRSACQESPLIPLFRASWMDGFMVGLMVRKSVAPHHDPPGSTESGGASGSDL